jgi:hypothetical protein
MRGNNNHVDVLPIDHHHDIPHDIVSDFDQRDSLHTHPGKMVSARSQTL